VIRNLIESIKKAFATPTAEQLILIEIEEAKRQLLQMQTAKDYSSRMVEYNMDRIRRLNTHMLKTTQEEQK